MDQDEWLETLRYANNAQDKVSVDTLMLRYRPIAPKPTTAEKSDHTTLSQDPTIIEAETQESNTCTMFNGGVTAEVVTWVTVESVISVSDGSSSSCTDVEMVDNLGKDTCPAFVSDGLNRVVWVNEAYRRNISGEDSISSRPPDVTVWLVAPEESTMAMYCNYKAFTCRVRIQYTWQETKYTKTAPCDVWRMEFGGFAWRLDTRAALTLWL